MAMLNIKFLLAEGFSFEIQCACGYDITRVNALNIIKFLGTLLCLCA